MKKPDSALKNLSKDEMAAVVNRIIDLRKKNNYTQNEFAKKLGVSQTYISMLESGEKPLSKSMLGKISSTFRISSSWLLFGSSDNNYSFEGSNKTEAEKHIEWYRSLPFDEQIAFAKAIKELFKILNDYPPGS